MPPASEFSIRRSSISPSPFYPITTGASLPGPKRLKQQAAKDLFVEGYRYKKAAVMLTGIIPKSEIQAELFSDQEYDRKQQDLMHKVDEINHKYGSRTTHFAGTGIEQDWQMKQEHLSDRYTTCWDELMEVE